MVEKSFLEIAVGIIKESKEPIAFKELFEKTLEKSGEVLSENDKRKHMSNLYTQLTFDGRLFTVDNKWDLKERNKFEQYYRDVSELDDTDDESDDEEEKELLKQESGELGSYDEATEESDSLSDFENKKSPEDEDF